MKKIPLFLLFLLFSLAGQARTRIQFDADWLFPDFVIVSPKKNKSSNIPQRECNI